MGRSATYSSHRAPGREPHSVGVVAEIVSTASVCLTFPPIPQPIVSRENILSAIDGHFGADTVVFVSGAPGTGKTTLLANYCLANDRTISVFLKPNSIGMTNPNLVRQEFFAQAHLLLEGHEPSAALEPTEEDYQSLILRLARRARQSLGRIVFVVDGFGEQTYEFQKLLLQSLLPTGMAMRDFRFLLSGETAPKVFKDFSISPKLVDLYGLSNHEAHFLFEDLVSDADIRNELIAQVGNGHVGTLSVLRQELEGGTPIEEAVIKAGEEYSVLLGQQWKSAIASDPTAEQLLSLLAFARVDYSTEELASAAGIDSQSAQDALERCGVANNLKQGWRLSNPHIQSLAQQNFADLRDEVTLRLSKLALESSKGQKDYGLAASYLADSARYDELLRLIDVESLTAVSREEKNYTGAYELAQLGARAARELGNPYEEFRTRHLGSAPHALSRSTVLESTVQALVNLGRFDRAYEVAATCPILPERLALLSLVAREQQELEGHVQKEAIEAIDAILEPAVKAMPRELLVRVGANLFVSYPGAALRLASQVSETLGEGDDGDKFIASVVLASEPGRDPHRYAESLDKVIAKTQSETIRAILSKLAQFASRKSLLALVEESEDWDDALALVVLERIAPHLIALGPDYSARVVKKLCEAALASSHFTSIRIRAIADALAGARLAGASSGLKELLPSLRALATAEHASPTADTIALKAEIVALESIPPATTDDPKGEFLSAYSETNEIDDLVVRLESISYYYLVASELIGAGILQASVRDHIRGDIRNLAKQVASCTAYHDSNFVTPARLLATVDLNLALEVSGLANTQHRRDLLTTESVKAHLEDWRSNSGFINEAFAIVSQADGMADLDELLEATVSCLERAPTSTGMEPIVDWIIRQAKRIPKAQLRLNVWTRLAQFLNQAPKAYDELDVTSSLQSLKREFLSDVNKIDGPWERLECLGIVGRYLTLDDSERTELLSQADSIIDSERLHTKQLVRLYALGLNLASTALTGAHVQGLTSDDDLERFAIAVRRLPRALDRVAIWERFATSLHYENTTATARKIVEQRLIPELDSVAQSNLDLGVCVVVSSPALFLYDSDVCRQYIHRVAPYDQKAAWHQISETLRRRGSLLNPFSERTPSLRLQYSECVKLLEALQNCATDAQILRGFAALEASLGKYDTILSPYQRQDVIQKMTSLAASALPDPDGIQHEGYRIWAEAICEKLSARTLKGPALDGLVKRARALPNASDSVFVLSILGRLASRAGDSERILEQAMTKAETLASAHERLERICEIAESYLEVSLKAKAQATLKKAWEYAGNAPDGAHLLDYQRRAIDIAYRVSPEFARELSDQVGKSAPNNGSSRLGRRQKVLQLRSHLLGVKKLPSEEKDHSPRLVAQAAYETLGALHADLATPPKPVEILERLEDLLGTDITVSYPAAALVTYSIIKSSGKKENVERGVRSALDTTLDWLDFVYAATAEISGRPITRVALPDATPVSQLAFLVEPGKRDEAIEFLRNWLIENASSRIVLLDQYYGPEDTEFLRICQDACPRVPIHILTSPMALPDGVDSYRQEELFETAWTKSNIGPPPKTFIYVVNKRAERKGPVHDRFLFGDATAISIGTSFNGLGLSVAQIDMVTPTTRQNLLEGTVEPILDGQTRLAKGIVSISKFELSS